MNNYDFTVLSPGEFEEFTRDLLSAAHGVTYSSFADGPDGGVDLRCAKDGSSTIVQCKRYSDPARAVYDLINKERPKIDNLPTPPQRYIIVTSVDLSRERVDALLEAFAPYLQSEEDILYPKKLNALLANHKEVELRHYKLWLSSSNVLQHIVNANVENYSVLTKERITSVLKTYAPVPYLSEAIEKLREHGFIIIAGPPGVGKTILAEVMSYHLLGDTENGFEELISIPRDFNDAITMLSQNPDAKQLFLFDDFLGTNFLDDKLSRHEDSVFSTLVDYISKKKKTKALIMTTREYILNQAQHSARSLNDEAVIDAKYILNAGRYDTATKSQILANHLAATDIPEEHLAYFLENKVYRKIVQHRNYVPRLIEAIGRNALWQNTTPAEFSDMLIEVFEKPWHLYEHIFENEIGDIERSLLLVLMSFGKQTPLVMLEKALLAYKGDACDEVAIKRALRVLDGSFVLTSVSKSNEVLVDFFNPTINDFLLHYYKTKFHTLRRLIETAPYTNQLTQVFAINVSVASIRSFFGDEAADAFAKLGLGAEKIVLDSDCIEAVEQVLTTKRHSLYVIEGTLARLYGSEPLHHASLLLSSDVLTPTARKAFIEDIRHHINNPDAKLVIDNVSEITKLYEYDLYHFSDKELNIEKLRNALIAAITSYDDLVAIQELSFSHTDNLLTQGIIEAIGDSVFIEELITDEALQRQSDDDDEETIIDDLLPVLDYFGVSDTTVQIALEASWDPPEDYEVDFYSRTPTDDDDSWKEREDDDNTVMDQIFGSLR